MKVQKPHLTKQGKKNRCKMENRTSNFGTSSSSTLLPQDSSSASASPVSERSDDLAPEKLRDSPKTQNKNKERDDKGASEDRSRDFPEWLVEFTENLEDPEVLAPAHNSHDSDSERPTKVAPRKHSFFTHFPKDRSCEVCLRTKMTRVPCRRHTGEAVL